MANLYCVYQNQKVGTKEYGPSQFFVDGGLTFSGGHFLYEGRYLAFVTGVEADLYKISSSVGGQFGMTPCTEADALAWAQLSVDGGGTTGANGNVSVTSGIVSNDPATTTTPTGDAANDYRWLRRIDRGVSVAEQLEAIWRLLADPTDTEARLIQDIILLRENTTYPSGTTTGVNDPNATPLDQL